MNSLFGTHKLNKLGIGLVAAIRNEFEDLLSMLEAALPTGRELSIVKTNLETACMYAVKAVSLDPRYQDND